VRIDSARPGAVVKGAILLGIVAGLIAAVFMTVVGEPWVDDAIAIEEASSFEDGAEHGAAGHEHEPEIVSRSDQKGIGLFLAYAITGGAFGLFFAVAFLGQRRGQPSVLRRALIAGSVLAGSITVAPWLKYPPNPPAVGDPDTLSQRQWQYLALIATTAAVGFLATRLGGHLGRLGWPEPQRVAAVAGFVVVLVGAALTLMPPPPDPVQVPANLVWHFRLASLGGNLLLWSVLTLGFAALTLRRIDSDGGRNLLHA
jgi:predicted cobalt transporter CbtA